MKHTTVTVERATVSVTVDTIQAPVPAAPVPAAEPVATEPPVATASTPETPADAAAAEDAGTTVKVLVKVEVPVRVVVGPVELAAASAPDAEAVTYWVCNILVFTHVGRSRGSLRCTR